MSSLIETMNGTKLVVGEDKSAAGGEVGPGEPQLIAELRMFQHLQPRNPILGVLTTPAFIHSAFREKVRISLHHNFKTSRQYSSVSILHLDFYLTLTLQLSYLLTLLSMCRSRLENCRRKCPRWHFSSRNSACR